MASRAYCEQVGTCRQDAGVSGEMAYLYRYTRPRRIHVKNFRINVVIAAMSF